ncbi:MAG: TldD/PmbA family protein [Thaumarchaeota archaeon]|nr:TldD/PmbA family protein [Nitrososphaerota archaeon]
MTEIADLAEKAVKEAVRLGASDVSALCYGVREGMVRFSNNSVTVTKNLINVELELYVAKSKKRILGASTNPSPNGIRDFVKQLLDACQHLPESPDYTPLPRGKRYRASGAERTAPVADKLLAVSRDAIDSALSEGAKRVSGALTSRNVALSVYTSTGVSGSDVYGSTVLNVRAFAEGDASGHGLSCAPIVTGIGAEEAGQRAGEYAKKAVGAKTCQAGTYDVIMSPTVAADIFQHVASAASAFEVDAGISFLSGKKGKRIAVNGFTAFDDPAAEGGLVRRRCDDEGVSTGKRTLIRNGKLETYLHNTTTARKFKEETTGNAGIITPHPWNLVVEPGDRSFHELVKEVNKGIIVTNNWYTRFQNTRTGEYSTLPRDAGFLIENGRIKTPVSGLRISDSIPRQLENIVAMSKERRWVQWWEVWLPTFTPWVLLKNVSITRAIG